MSYKWGKFCRGKQPLGLISHPIDVDHKKQFACEYLLTEPCIPEKWSDYLTYAEKDHISPWLTRLDFRSEFHFPTMNDILNRNLLVETSFWDLWWRKYNYAPLADLQNAPAANIVCISWFLCDEHFPGRNAGSNDTRSAWSGDAGVRL